MSARGRCCLAAAALLALALGGCGQQQPTARAAVATYLKRVQRTESDFQQPLANVAKVGSVLAQEERGGSLLTTLARAADEASLQRAAGALQRLGSELAAIPAPAAAAHRRALRLERARRQLALARELTGLVVFLPQFSTALRGLAPATHRLQLALAQPAVSGASAVAAAYQFKATALRQFGTAVQRIAVALRSVKPPAVWAPAYDSQMASLDGMRADAARLAGALEGGATSQFGQLMLDFDRDATISQTVAAQRARIRAVRAYDAEVETLNKLAAAIEVERLRLVSTLPE